MKCPKCNKKNITKASYCINCKYKFTEEEQEKAYKKTIFGRLESLEEWYYHLTLATITDHIAFKILMVLIVLGLGLFYFFTRGIDTSILSSNSYEVYYNEKAKEYYLLTEDNIDEINLELYIPNRLEELYIEKYDTNNKLLESSKYDEESDIKFKSYNNDYYIIKSIYKNKTDNMKFYIYKKSNVEIEQ